MFDNSEKDYRRIQKTPASAPASASASTSASTSTSSSASSSASAESEAERLARLDSFCFDDLTSLMAVLRAPGGCPWDGEQTHKSLKRYLIEEAYETLEAIDNGDDAALCEELGDVLLQVVFHANVSEKFCAKDVINGICKKMINRHPHIFAGATARTSADVTNNWEKIKREEKGLSDRTSVLKDVPKNLPALMRAFKVQQKASDAGFDWEEVAPVIDKVKEELGEVEEAYGLSSDSEAREAALTEEVGDLFFAVVNLARKASVHPELALAASTEKFIGRFELMESLATGDGRSLEDMSLCEMDAYWDKAKEIQNRL